MYRIILYIVLVSAGAILSAGICHAIPVDGYCYLENQTNHSGTKVFFQADSPTAVTDSTCTDSSGYYQADLQMGIYDITYSHQGYYDYSLPNQLITTQTTLPAVTLESLPPYVPLYGYLSGVLHDTLYLVIGNCEIDTDDSLIIEPGAIILFDGNYYFEIFGYLYAVGTEEDSIVFASRGGGYSWRGIDIKWRSDPSSILKYCYITGSDYGGIGFADAEATVENCTIRGNDSAVSGAGGITCGYSDRPVIRNCDIIDNTAESTGGGVSCADESHPIIENCRIEQNSANSGGGAVRSKDESTPEFINCVISNNGPEGGIDCYNDAHPIIRNCVIDGNWDYSDDGNGIECSSNSYVTVINTTITNNSYTGIEFNSASSGLSTIIYCDFFNDMNFRGHVAPPFIGEIVTVNANGDSCDIYSNIFLDPLFYSTTGDSAFFLTENSPCIDAGDPESPLDPDGTIADIGAFYFDQSLPGIEDLTITIDVNDIILSWTEIPDAVSYNIYRSDEPYFDISLITPIASVTQPEFVDENVLPEGPYFYIVTYEY